MPPGEEIYSIMTITCPLCANPNEVLSQPSSISWKQVPCSSCQANLVLVRESSSGTLRQPQKSGAWLRLVLPGARKRSANARLRLISFLITILAFGVLGYLFFKTDLLPDVHVPV
jgi:hypothetical protein